MKRMGLLKRVGAIALAAALLLSNRPGLLMKADAEELAHGGIATKVTDPATVNGWKDFFGGLDTSLSGSVWNDKSVFEKAEDYFAATDEDEAFDVITSSTNHFLVALSTIATTKTIVGYSYLPTDTVFVLDVSGSMIQNNSTKAARMVDAANKAIGDLQALNNYNRVAVILYSGNTSQGNSGTGTATVLLPLDRYTTTSTTTVNNESVPEFIDLSQGEVEIVSGVRNSDNGRVTGGKAVEGGTYIQNGIWKGMQELIDPDNETVITDGFQVGTTRTPIMVLMSDGAPTAALNGYASTGTSNIGDGTYSNADMAFMTQLSAAYAKAKIQEKYGDEVDTLFYTLGLGVGNDENALSVMDPTNAGANDDVNEYWTNEDETGFNDIAEGKTVTLTNSTYWVNEGSNMRPNWKEYNRTVTKLNDGTNDGVDNLPLEQNYVTEYFSAGTANELANAFQSIVDMIILQTMYSPTKVEDGDIHHSGYVEFRDYIGANMEVKEVKGVQLGETLFTGEKLAQLVATGMGTVQNPTDAGNNLVWSVMERLGIEDVQVARDLLTAAWTSGQLAYNEDYDGDITWSNKIGWYADENEKYLGFWDGGEIDPSIGATYANMSYGFLGEAGPEHRATDMLYASVSVRKHLNPDGSEIEDVVYAKFPSSLIPLVEYHVELDANNPVDATEITLTKTGAEAPARLLYEVGLREGLDLLDIEGTMFHPVEADANGNYVFYTNQWDSEHETDTPDKYHNTWVHFVPSEENERFYYHEDMPIYVKSGDSYRIYTGSKPTATNGTYYRAYVIYKATTNGGAATYEINYQQIPARALADENVEPSTSGNSWVVNKGTIYLEEARGATLKTSNPTGTRSCSEYPSVHWEGGYHLDAILGNNGRLTIDPPEGLKLTKSIDDTIADEGQTYTFRIELVSGTHDSTTKTYMVKESDGVRSAWTTATFDNGVFEVDLAVDETVYIIGLPVGNVYEITELVDGDYTAQTILVNGNDETTVDNTAGFTVSANTITEVAYTNTAVRTGNVAVSKNVVSDLPQHKAEDFTFTFDIQVTGADPNTTYATVYHLPTENSGAVTVANGPAFTTDATGAATLEGIELYDASAIVILELPETAAVTATEVDLPGGFTSDRTNNTASVDVVIGETTSIVFTNTYQAAPVSPAGIVDVYVQKVFDGRPWEPGDSFTFRLEKHVSSNQHTVLEEVTVGYNDADKIADFQSNISELYTETGTYSYRITEVAGNLPGVAYDNAICYFDIVVSDDGEGHLYVSDVIAGQDVTATKTTVQGVDTWDVEATFKNLYSAQGAIQISVDVRKELSDPANTGMNKGGFEFELYGANQNFEPATTPLGTVTTNAEGVAAFADMVFTQEGEFYLVLKEKKGNLAGMTYDAEKYNIHVVVDSDPATSGLVATVVVTDAAGSEVFNQQVSYVPGQEGETAAIPTITFVGNFENTYKPDPAEWTISGHKELTGRELKADEFTFQLYRATFDGRTVTYSENDLLDTADNGADGTFAFEKQTYTKVGTYYYAVTEKEGTLGGMTYDQSVYYVRVAVTVNAATGMLEVSSVNVLDADLAPADLVFANSYKADPVAAQIMASKRFTGTRQLAEGMFQFSIFENGSAEALQTVSNDADGNVIFDLEYDQVGIYTYTVRERIPANAVNNKHNGVVYDPAVYNVTVTVTDDLDGQLVASVAYSSVNAPEFVNDYTPDPTSAVISGDKVLSGRNQTAGEFTFELYQTDAKFSLASAQLKATTVSAETANGFGFSFTENYDVAGGYRYIVVEKPGDSDRITYDPAVFYVLVNVTDNGRGQLVSDVVLGNSHTNGNITSPISGMEFYNVFTPAPAQLTFDGIKTLENNDLAADTFTFELYEADAEFDISESVAVMTATNKADGTFAFAPVTFEQQGTFYYVVKEQLPAGVTKDSPMDAETSIIYDVSEYHITVTVDIDPNNPERLKATYTVADDGEIAFTNTFVPDPVPYIIRAKKTYDKGLVGNDFTFTLYDADGKKLESVKNDASGVVTFSALSLDAAGTYTYTVKETDKLLGFISYSVAEYKVTVKVVNEHGVLRIESATSENTKGTAERDLEFVNTYIMVGEDQIILRGIKYLTGDRTAVKDGEFTFGLYDAQGTLIESVKNDANGNFAFTALKFDQDDTAINGAGQHLYTVREIAGTAQYMTYDTTVYNVEIIVADNDQGGIAVTCSVNGTPNGTIKFTNTYDEPEPEIPETGDNSLVFLWIALLVVSGCGLATVGVLSFKKRTAHK